MRLKIKSTDRIGISQEILSVFAKKLWNIKSVEVEPCLTYVHVEEENLALEQITRAVLSIAGTQSCEVIELLPAERNAKHLATLLAKIPDPIFDIDNTGKILNVNKAASNLIIPPVNLAHSYINDFIQPDIRNFITPKAQSIEVTFMGKNYIAEITSVLTEEKISGAVITLRSLYTVGRQISLLQTTNAQSIDNILGHSAPIKTLKAQAMRFSELDLPVLISGETGTGKELFARALHEHSERAQAPFLAINCAALPENLLESELFGYAAGAFSGAQRAGKPGLFELANGGTVFLDEIAEMSMYLQAKLLRFLQDYSYRRVGGTQELTTDVRIVSASHQNLITLVNKQEFREDLFYRINVLNLNLPPLRERIEDINLLADHFIQQACLQTNHHNVELTHDARTLLQTAYWSGNIRQLQNVLFSAVALTTTSQIDAKAINQLLTQQSTSLNKEQPNDNVEQYQDWQSAQQAFEAQLLTKLYPLYPSTRKLAQRLKVSHNKIALKLREHNIQK